MILRKVLHPGGCSALRFAVGFMVFVASMGLATLGCLAFQFAWTGLLDLVLLDDR